VCVCASQDICVSNVGWKKRGNGEGDGMIGLKPNNRKRKKEKSFWEGKLSIIATVTAHSRAVVNDLEIR
jgi:hypothetical protein